MKSIQITKPDGILRGRIKLPSSKSISNRLLIIEALSGREFGIENLSGADDTVLLKRLLATIRSRTVNRAVTELDAGNAGTVMRFLTAYAAITPGKWMLTGSFRMKQRPVGILAEALKSLGASIEYLAKPGYPPLLITGRELKGKSVSIDAGVSSQYTTALLMIAPCLPGGLTINLKGKWASSPYIDMTIWLMESSGITVTRSKQSLRVRPGRYKPGNFQIEADWSAAAFWYEAAVFAQEVDIVLEGLTSDSLQGDAMLPAIYRNFGIETEFLESGIRLTRVPKKIDGFYHNFFDTPDIAQAVIATCAGLSIRGRFEGVKSLIIKETDRLRAMKNEIEKLGVKVSVSSRTDSLHMFEIEPSRTPFPGEVVFETYGDHRMAMALAPLALKIRSLKIRNPDVVVKSYPDYWEHLKNAGFNII